MPKFNLGDTAYHAHSGQTKVWITCPECLGTGRLRVILGDDSQVSIDCVCCERGYEGSPGRISTWEFRAEVDEVRITGIDSELKGYSGDNLVTRYKHSGCYSTDEDNLFITREEAQARAEQLVIEHDVAEKKMLACKEKQTHTWAWNVSYHRRQIKEAQRQIEYHSAKLAAAAKQKKADAEASEVAL